MDKKNKEKVEVKESKRGGKKGKRGLDEKRGRGREKEGEK